MGQRRRQSIYTVTNGEVRRQKCTVYAEGREIHDTTPRDSHSGPDSGRAGALHLPSEDHRQGHTDTPLPSSRRTRHRRAAPRRLNFTTSIDIVSYTTHPRFSRGAHESNARVEEQKGLRGEHLLSCRRANLRVRVVGPRRLAARVAAGLGAGAARAYEGRVVPVAIRARVLDDPEERVLAEAGTPVARGRGDTSGGLAG